MNKYFTKNYLEPEKQAKPPGISGSGGGCFPAGTLVRTAAGLRCIDKILPGESVVSYDRHGELSLAYVTEVLTHKTNPTGAKLYFIYSKGVSLFPKGITGNHAVFCKQENNHKKAEELQIGETLCTMEGEELPISLILRDDLTVPVYNLIVEPTHTYLVGTTDLLIKVHNGGGGKDSAEPRAAEEAPNTLQSSAVAKVLEVISHGEIAGIVGGAKGVTFNNTALQNPDNSFNFKNIIFTERKGLPSQLPVEGFEETESEVAITPTEITSASVIQQLPNSNIPVARVTIRLPGGLWRQNLTNGDLNGYSVSFTIDVKERTSGTWSNVLTKTISDKTRSPWEIAYRLVAPAGAVQWDIRITRTSAVDGTADKSSALFFQRITEITDDNLSYPDIAYVGLQVTASSTGNRIPTRAYLVKGLLVEVPNIYDPVLRTYGATYWTGVFKTAWTDNTAWVLYSLITNTEWGLADFLGQTIDVDIFAFYEAALYCDSTSWNGTTYTQNLLPDGEGGFEVRFKFNSVIQVQSDAWQLLQAVASNMNAIVIMKGGQISLIQDRPKAVSRLFNNSNVIDGSFLYSSSQSSDRATAVNCTFNDKFDRFLPRTISEEDTAAITKFGHSSKDIVSYGTVTESQARRACKAVLYNELNLVDNVAFSVGLNIIDIEIGSIISVMDNEYVSNQNTYLSGRVSGVAGQVVSLDRPVTLDVGHTYTFGIMSLDYKSIDEYTITDVPGTYSELTVTGVIPAGDYSNHEFFCYSSGYIEPRLFQVLSITESEKGIYAVFGMFYNPDKFNIIEQGLVVTLPSYFTLISAFVPKVTNINFKEIYLNNGTISQNYLIVSWDWEAQGSAEVVEYSLRWRKDSGTYAYEDKIGLKEFTIPSSTTGIYEVVITAKNLQNKVSNAATASYTYRTTVGSSSLLPPINFYVKGTAGAIFYETALNLVWGFATANEITTDTLQKYKLDIYTADGLTLKNTYYTLPEPNRSGVFTYTEAMNVSDFGSLQRQVRVKIYSVDMVNDLSAELDVTFNNTSPAAPTGVTLFSGDGQAILTYTPPTDLDFEGIVASYSEVSGFVPTLANAIYTGTDTTVTIPNLTNGTVYFFRLASYDAFGTDSIVYGVTEYTVTPSSTALTPVDVQTALQTALDAPAANALEFETDLFLIRSPTTDTIPFAVFNDGVSDFIRLAADVQVMGQLIASQIISGDLSVAETISLGNGIIDLAGDGSIKSYSGNRSVANRDFALLTSGLLDFFVYRDAAYHQYKSVKRRVSGIANSGDLVTIPGYFKNTPEIVISIKDLTVYSVANNAQSQKIALNANSITELTPEQWSFVASAEMTSVEGTGTVVINEASGTITADTFTSLTQTTPANTTDITADVTLTSKRYAGYNTEYMYRKMQCRIVYRISGGSWIFPAYTIVNMGQSLSVIHPVSLSLSGLTPGVYEFYVEYTAEDIWEVQTVNKMFLLQKGTTRTIFPYTLDTPWNLLLGTVSEGGVTITATGDLVDIKFSPDGLTMFVLTSTRELRQYSLTVPFNLHLTFTFQVTSTVGQSGSIHAPSSFFLSPDGFNLYVLDIEGYVFHYTLALAYDLLGGKTLAFTFIIPNWGYEWADNEFDDPYWIPDIFFSIYFNETGTKLTVTDTIDPNNSFEEKWVREYPLSTPWTLSSGVGTVVAANTFDKIFSLSKDGTKAFSVDWLLLSPHTVKQSTLTTPGTLSAGASLDGTFYHGTELTRDSGINLVSEDVNTLKTFEAVTGVSEIPENSFTFDGYNYTLSTGVTFASGSVHWTAIGD